MRAKILFISGVLALLVGCSISLPQIAAKQQSGCADKFAAQMTTAEVVPGAYECMAAPGRAQFANATELANYSKQEPVISLMRPLGRSESGAYVFAARTSQGPAIFLIQLDHGGKVAGIRGSAG